MISTLITVMIVWMLSKMLGLLSCPACSALFDKAETAVKRLLSLVKLKDPFGFHLIFSDLISCLADLVVAFETFFDDSDDSDSWTLRQLGADTEPVSFGDCDLSFDSLTLPDAKSCALLQMTLTRVFTELVDGPWTTTMQQYDILWATLACQLENGNVALKQVRLECNASKATT